MAEYTEGKVALRKATPDEIDFLNARAVRHDQENFKKNIRVAVIAVLGPVVFFILNETRYHKPSYRILSCVLFIGALIVAGIFLLSYRKFFSKLVAKGEFTVQRGKILEIREPNRDAGMSYHKIVFESDDGITSVLDIQNDFINEMFRGPCLIIKWDSYGETEVYEVAMLEQEK